MMRRREFITLLSGAAAWPLAARAQQGDRVRRIGVLLRPDENDASMKAALSAFTQGLGDLGWTDGRNMRIEVRWAGGNPDRIRIFAKELVDLQPDVILAGGFAAANATQQQTRTIPLIFVGVVGEQTAVSGKERLVIDRRYVVPGRRRYDRRAM